MFTSFESTLLTAEDLKQIRLPDKRTELVSGGLVVRERQVPSTGGYRRTGRTTSPTARRHGLGVVFGQDTGFRTESSSDTVRDLTIVVGDGRLDGETAVPGFSCPLADVLR